MKSHARGDLTTTLIGEREAAPETSTAREWLLIAMSGANVGKIYPLSKTQPLIVLGRGDDVDVQILDGEISRRHAAIRFDATKDSFIVCDLGSRNGTHVNGKMSEGDTIIAVGDKLRLGAHAVLRVSSDGETESAYAKQMYQAALRDPLTGAFNRRYLDERLESELAFSKRHRDPLALLLLDLDRFKAINDGHGHQAGDAVLVHFCAILAQQVRTEDVVARYGGEEFAVVCRQTDEVRAAILGERLRAAVAASPAKLAEKEIAFTVSIGIAGHPCEGLDTVSQLIDSADAALYQAKRSGRNQVCLASRLSGRPTKD